MTTSPRLTLPYMQASQAQKHVTHNEALARLDAVTQMTVAGFDAETPPSAPVAGEMHALGAAPTGVWAGQGGMLAQWDGTAWLFIAPGTGWRAWGVAEAELRVHDGAAWIVVLPELQNLAGIGIATSWDATNRLAVASDAVLFSHAGADHRVKVNKAATGDTASLLFQTGWSGRAEMGLAGSDDFAIKVSADGAAYATALSFDAGTGQVSGGAAVQAGPGDAGAGKLLQTGAFGLGADQAIAEAIDLDAIGVSGFFTNAADDTVANLPAAHPQMSILSLGSAATDSRTQLASHNSGAAPQLHARASSGGGFGPWAELYHSANLLGTVAQDTGAPTGAVIENGSNANGSYVRFADGTQICRHRINAVPVTTATTLAGLFQSADISWTFPAAFVNDAPANGPFVGARADHYSVIAGNAQWFGVTSAMGAIRFTAYSSVTVDTQVFAIGRWF